MQGLASERQGAVGIILVGGDGLDKKNIALHEVCGTRDLVMRIKDACNGHVEPRADMLKEDLPAVSRLDGHHLSRALARPRNVDARICHTTLERLVQNTPATI